MYRMSIINTPSRPYLKWLADGTKTAEGRVNTPSRKKMRVGDYIFLFDDDRDQNIYGQIEFKHEYKTFKDMLLNEGVKNMLPFLESKDLEQGIKIYEDFPGSERVKKFGCVAIGIEVIKAKL
jgi:ASC-1-like (ASCH) protein